MAAYNLSVITIIDVLMFKLFDGLICEGRLGIGTGLPAGYSAGKGCCSEGGQLVIELLKQIGLR